LLNGQRHIGHGLTHEMRRRLNVNVKHLTKAGLEAKNGTDVLGNRTNLAEAQAKGAAAGNAQADAFAVNVLPIIQQIQRRED
jgi:hypothetical protein